jgi:predicted branched-subunit amino acid permease
VFALTNSRALFIIRVMRSFWRTLDRALIRDILAIALAVGVVGASFGTLAVSAGLSWWLPPLMSVLVFAGGSQFLAVGVIAAGGGPVAAVLGGLCSTPGTCPTAWRSARPSAGAGCWAATC